MKVLFIGGSGIISSACSQLALSQGIDLWLLNRGRKSVPAGAKLLQVDLTIPGAAADALHDHQWDAVVQWLAYTPQEVERDLALFRGKTEQYIYISSASAYQKPLGNYIITESTPLANPFWDYSRNKIACEDVLQRAFRAENFPAVVVRPSLTYGNTQIPLVLNAWLQPWTIIQRLRRGLPVIVPGDGTSLWTITHNSDFAQGLVGLLGNKQSVGHSFHITSDEVLTWDQLFQETAQAAGAPPPKLVHIASDYLVSCVPDWRGTLHGDKAASAIFDNTKIKRFVPTYLPRVSFAEGIRRTMAWFEEDASRQVSDRPTELLWDKVIANYEQGLDSAAKSFRS